VQVAVLRSVCWLNITAGPLELARGHYTLALRIYVDGYAGELATRLAVEAPSSEADAVVTASQPPGAIVDTRQLPQRVWLWLNLGSVAVRSPAGARVTATVFDHSGEWKSRLRVDYLRVLPAADADGELGVREFAACAWAVPGGGPRGAPGGAAGGDHDRDDRDGDADDGGVVDGAERVWGAPQVDVGGGHGGGGGVGMPVHRVPWRTGHVIRRGMEPQLQQQSQAGGGQAAGGGALGPVAGTAIPEAADPEDNAAGGRAHDAAGDAADGAPAVIAGGRGIPSRIPWRMGRVHAQAPAPSQDAGAGDAAGQEQRAGAQAGTDRGTGE
jgi:hypothetical protein